MANQVSSQDNKSYPIMKLTNISKTFTGIKAVDEVSLEINSGEILAVLGENGAGKSTLMKILSGIHQPEKGSIHINLNWFLRKQNMPQGLMPFRIFNPNKAIQIGIGMVYQHFKLIEPLTVRDNIMLGNEITIGRTNIIDYVQADRDIENLGKTYGMPINPETIIEELSVGIKQRVEILKQLYREAQLLILDEPTAVLTPAEVEELFNTMRELKAAGKSIIFISHKLKEPLNIADRIIVMRKGKIIGETKPSDATEVSLAEMMVGRRVLMQLERSDVHPGKSILEVENLTIKNQHGFNAIDNISFEIRENEIVGIAGVQGNGQTELIDGLMGLRKDLSGSIKYYQSKGRDTAEELANKSTLQILEKGIAYIPEDRSKQGLIHEFPIHDNTWLGLQSQPIIAEEYLGEKKESAKFSLKNFLIPSKLLKRFAIKVIEDFDVMTPDIYVTLKNLSGGNQQKVILGREFAKNPRLIIASQPTRGVDVGVTEKVRNALLKMRDQGTGVLLVSSDLDEILSLSDYILVLYEGQIVGRGPIKDFTTLEISQLMTGGSLGSPKQTTQKQVEV
ncbi:MAG: Ribose import ATP-binding protein RbsA [Candidatus Heimdallarchaeota archaeon LC_3]|nr:MAG: Ribose import ATP-binding protein RbsA [Candidatus Heimdallarchaeota archaeon LC_3]